MELVLKPRGRRRRLRVAGRQGGDTRALPTSPEGRAADDADDNSRSRSRVAPCSRRRRLPQCRRNTTPPRRRRRPRSRPRGTCRGRRRARDRRRGRRVGEPPGRRWEPGGGASAVVEARIAPRLSRHSTRGVRNKLCRERRRRAAAAAPRRRVGGERPRGRAATGTACGRRGRRWRRQCFAAAVELARHRPQRRRRGGAPGHQCRLANAECGGRDGRGRGAAVAPAVAAVAPTVGVGALCSRRHRHRSGRRARRRRRGRRDASLSER